MTERVSAITRMTLILDTIDANVRAAYPTVSPLSPLHDQLLAAINGVEFARRALAEIAADA